MTEEVKLTSADKQRLWHRADYAAHPEKYKARYEARKNKTREWYQAHKAERLQYQKAYVDENKTRVINYQHNYYLQVTQKKRGHEDRVPKAPVIKEITKSKTAKAFHIIPIIEAKPREKNNNPFLVSFN